MKLGTQTTYPDFVPNQILTNSQLNDLREHLDLQDRATRKKLIGTGLVCGFRWSLAGPQNARKLTLSEGLGMTSNGYLACLCESVVFTRVRAPYRDPDLEENGKTPRYGPWRTSPTGTQRKMMELVAVPAGQAPDGTRLLKQQDLDGRVLVLYLELEPVELRSCFVTECDNKGRKVNVNLRALAVRQEHLKKAERCTGSLEFFRVPRLHTVKPLDKVAKATDIDQGYRVIVRKQVPRLVEKIKKAFTVYEQFLDLKKNHVDVLDSVFSPALLSAAPINQYQYGALKDMATAYNEFVEAACELVPKCCPADEFPRHLMLGEFGPSDRRVSASSTPRDDFRHRFYRSAVQNVIDDDFDRVRKLFVRMSTIARHVAFAKPEVVRLTPSRGEEAALGQRAIPYYLDPTKIGDVWQPKMCCINDKTWSYHDHKGAHDGAHDHEHDVSDLGFNDYNRSSLIRVEGHVGENCAEARRAIVRERHLHNAEFDVLVTNFDDPTPKLKEAAKKIEALIVLHQRQIDEYYLLVSRAIASRDFSLDEIRATRKDAESLEREIREVVNQWIDFRALRRLHCDVSHLETMYIDLRAEFLCLLGGLGGELQKIRDEVGSLVELPEGELAFEMLDRLESQARGASHGWLPRRLSRFNYRAFVHAYKGIIHDVTRYWVAWRAFGFPVQKFMAEHGRSAPWPAGGEAISSVLLGFSRGCFHTRFARLFHALGELWENDPSFFPNLARKVDGLEHLAGVRRCGTFVVVCDRKAGSQARSVHADFSLSCRLPCCCDTEIEDLCLPPVALAGHRVVRLEEEDGESFAPVAIQISLRQAGIEPNFLAGEDSEARPPLRIKVESGETPMGGKLEFGEDTQLVFYRHEKPRPGIIDSFEYTLISAHECFGDDELADRSDVGKFWIAMEAPPRKPQEPKPEPEPEPETNTVCGTVLLDGQPLTAFGGAVHIREVRHPITVGFDREGKPGFYESPPLPFGKYHLTASFGDFLSKEVEVKIKAGPKTEQNLTLEAKRSLIRFRVVNQRGGLQEDSTVTMLNAKDESILLTSETPDNQGFHSFAAVPPGIYLVQAAAKGFRTSVIDRFSVSAGRSAEETIVLKPTISLPGNFSFATWFERGLDPVETRIEVEKTYNDRFLDGRQKVVAKGKTVPGLATSKPYARAREFMTSIVPELNLPIEELTPIYGKVADGIARSIAQPGTPAAKKAMQEVLTEVSKAYLDRVSIERPSRANQDVQLAVRSVLSALERGRVTTAKFKSVYKVAELEQVAVTKEINQLMQ